MSVSHAVLDDLQRLALMRSLDLLRPHADPSFDRVTALAARATKRPTALMTFIGPEGQWVASRHGWEQTFHPLSESFCLYTLLENQPVEVCDASADPRFIDNALVTGLSHVRFYAGYPLKFDGHVLGALCVLDRTPAELAAGEMELLEHLAGLVSDLLQVRLERSKAQQEHRRAEELMHALELSRSTLRESEERYRLLWQTTTDAVVLIDEQETIRFANPAIEAVFGYAPEEVLDQPLAMLQPERLRAAHRSGFAAYLRTGQRRLNWRATRAVGRRKGGAEVPIELAFSELEGGNGRQFAAFIRDVTERHRAETALKNSEAQFRALTALSSDWYWELDNHFRYTYLSEGAARSGMVDPQKAIGHTPWEVLPLMDETAWHQQSAKIIRREPFKDFEMTLQGPDGVQVLCISGEPIFDAQGEFAGYRGVGRNVTEERRAQDARRELADHLRESQKLEAIGVLAGGIAHDFNNVLAGILGNAKLALDDLAPSHPAAQSLQQIRKAGLRGREMVQQILTFARRRPRKLTACDLRDLVDETLGLLRATVPRTVTVHASMPSRPLRIVADATQVEQALINLCANAWQAMAGEKGHIEIRGEPAELVASASERLGGLPAGPYVHLQVCDNGPGMDEATAKRVFEPFFTTKPEGEGTGLGLSVVHGIVTGHGGAVMLDSALGKGTTVHLWFPADQGVEATEPLPLEHSVPQGHGRRVFYVDDDEVITLMVSRLLEKCGYRVTGFCDAAEALESFQRMPWEVDAIITDLNMPRLSGLELSREVQRLRPGLPVILGSGNLLHELGDDFAQSGVAATFHKQNAIEELPVLIAEVLGLTAKT
jgi:PAS domain S-box-containing protein